MCYEPILIGLGMTYQLACSSGEEGGSIAAPSGKGPHYWSIRSPWLYPSLGGQGHKTQHVVLRNQIPQHPFNNDPKWNASVLMTLRSTLLRNMSTDSSSWASRPRDTRSFDVLMALFFIIGVSAPINPKKAARSIASEISTKGQLWGPESQVTRWHSVENVVWEIANGIFSYKGCIFSVRQGPSGHANGMSLSGPVIYRTGC